MDSKWLVISARSGVKVGIISALAWALMDYASQNEDRGNVEGFDTEMYAVYSGFSEVEIKKVIQAMKDKGVITDNRLTNWEKRQPKSESEIKRVTEWRNKQKEEAERYALLQDVTKNYTDTDTESDTDTEKERENAPSDPFSKTLSTIERITGLPPDNGAPKAIEEIVQMGATPADIQEGYNWIKGQRRTLKFYGSLVGPTRTAMSRRVSAEHPAREPTITREEVLRSLNL
jgi:hypothetical protein